MTTLSTNAHSVEATADGKVLKLVLIDKVGLAFEETATILLKLHSEEDAARMADGINLSQDTGGSVPEWMRTAAKEEDERNG